MTDLLHKTGLLHKTLQKPRRRVFLFPFIGVVIFTFIASVVLELVLRNWYMATIRIDMQQIISTTVDSIERIGADIDELPIVVESISLVTPHYHITVANDQGKVVADSTSNGNSLFKFKNILNQQEFIAAKQNGLAEVTRRSEIENIRMLFLSKHVSTPKFDGVIRVGLRMEAFQQTILEIRYMLALLAVSAVASMGLLVMMFSRYLQASMRKEQALLESRVEERTQDIFLLHRLTNMLAACKSLEEVQLVVEDIVPRIIGDINCSISLVNPARNLVEKKIDWSGKWPGKHTFEPVDCWALRKGKYHFSHDQYSSQTCPHMGENNENTLCIPLIAHGNAIGLLHMIVKDKLNESDHQLAFTIAEHFGLALANIDMQEKLRAAATRDPLTSLYNRRQFDDVMDKEVSRSQRHHEPFALLMLDIDHFKRFNDSFGHDAGDYVLKVICTLIKDSVRSEDTACRLGGEELAVILPESKITNAIACAEKLSKLIREKNFQYNNEMLGTVTVSIGIAVYPNHGQNKDELTKAGDVALYKAKDKGRNCYELAEEDTSKQPVYDIMQKTGA